MSRFVVLCLVTLFTSFTWAQGPMVVSTHPIYLIAKEITRGVEEPKLLLEHQTGHDVQLTPAHRKMIQDASLVIWLGKAHEAPLANVLAQKNQAISILDAHIVHTLPMRNSRGGALKNAIDTHVWLEPNNAVRIGFFIAALRSQQHPEHKQVYWANAKKFAKDLFHTSQQFKLSGQAKPYWAYHDAYQYLERSLNLKFAGALTEDAHMAPTIAQIKYLSDTRPQTNMCLLAESTASANQYKKLGDIHFQVVDESFSLQQNFIVAWKKLAMITLNCVGSHKK
ncbi:zinc ABC transporter solute-binding protein [Acinetobacter sp. 194]|uniref:metal ABC transporter solute-binding protein, Zn/Mn family n=1 Tax=Acinetobacter shaoyimingii TaxID=2715164 RepID=UPI0014077875|nr:zinc ABC transporter substrate-binding protein [Acinetobacter shaoyimingii]NHB59331.1 zinc ABC transporter solute-binding protein [Acinetobacter shaoyimingii]